MYHRVSNRFELLSSGKPIYGSYYIIFILHSEADLAGLCLGAVV